MNFNLYQVRKQQVARETEREREREGGRLVEEELLVHLDDHALLVMGSCAVHSKQCKKVWCVCVCVCVCAPLSLSLYTHTHTHTHKHTHTHTQTHTHTHTHVNIHCWSWENSGTVMYNKTVGQESTINL